MAIVYQHIRLDTNEVFYIGVGVNMKRAYSKKCRNRFWKSIISKVEYKVEILYSDIDYEEALNIEVQLIELHGRRVLGTGSLVNIDKGGRGCSGYPQSIESIAKRVSKMIGRKCSDETRKKLRTSNLGKRRSDKTREANRKANLGKRLSDECKQKISEALLKSTNKAKFKSGIKIINTQTGEIYKSISMAANIANVPIETFRRWLNSSSDKCKPFKYLDK